MDVGEKMPFQCSVAPFLSGFEGDLKIPGLSSFFGKRSGAAAWWMEIRTRQIPAK